MSHSVTNPFLGAFHYRGTLKNSHKPNHQLQHFNLVLFQMDPTVLGSCNQFWASYLNLSFTIYTLKLKLNSTIISGLNFKLQSKNPNLEVEIQQWISGLKLYSLTLLAAGGATGARTFLKTFVDPLNHFWFWWNFLTFPKYISDSPWCNSKVHINFLILMRARKSQDKHQIYNRRNSDILRFIKIIEFILLFLI